MLSSSDYEKYLSQMETVEQTMANIYKEGLGKITDGSIKQVIASILQDELSHVEIVQKIRKLISV